MYPHAERSVQYRYADERALHGSRPWSAHIFSCFQLQRCGCSAHGAAWSGAQGDTGSSRPPAANPAPPAHSSNSVDAAFCWSDTSPKYRVHGLSGHPIVTPVTSNCHLSFAGTVSPGLDPPLGESLGQAFPRRVWFPSA